MATFTTWVKIYSMKYFSNARVHRWVRRTFCPSKIFSCKVYIIFMCRLMWQRIRAMQMFLEHVLMKHSEVSVAYARRLDFVSLSFFFFGWQCLAYSNIINLLISSSSVVTRIS